MRLAWWLAIMAAPALAVNPGVCESCHEIRPMVDQWRSSSHRNVECTKCHEYSTMRSARRFAAHMKGEVPEQPKIGLQDIDKLVERCGTCHQQQYAEWKAGPHSASYSRIFADKAHNQKRKLMDDCLRCHGMHFEGNIGEMVRPVDANGPWTIVRRENANRPSMPCMACHSIHRFGEPTAKPEQRVAGKQPVVRPSLALFDRRGRMHISAAALPIPAVMDGDRPVKMSPDPRQGLCYQCHAPLAGNVLRSGDDRTPAGVHEGLSCFACHQGHQMNTRASCATCHPKLSNCGLDVEKMDTTFKDAKSRFDIHTVKCSDCHPKGIPKRKETIRSSTR
jgi:hypothetical protein